MNLANVLRAMLEVGANLPAFKSLFDQAVGTFSEADQASLQAAYRDVMAENDAGHRRLQAKLAAAEKL